MPRLTICTYHWGSEYGEDYVEQLERRLRRCVAIPFDFRVLRYDQPQASDKHRCFPKLNLYRSDIGLSGPVLGVDLDLDFTADVTAELVEAIEWIRSGGFIGCRIERRIANNIVRSMPEHHACRINSSLVMFMAGQYQYLWDEFPEHYNPQRDRNDEVFIFWRLKAHNANVRKWPASFISRWNDNPSAKILAYTGLRNQEKMPWRAQSRLDSETRSSGA